MVTTMMPALALTSRGDEPFRVIRRTLPNGLRVWLQPRSDSSSVTALLVIRAGARYEQLANNGISHFVEHMVFAGTERWSEEEIKDTLTRRGGRWNGWTGTETTTYFAQVSSQDLDLALDWLAQVGNFVPDQALDKSAQYLASVTRQGHPSPPEATTLSNNGPHQVTVRGPMPTDQTQLRLGAQTVGRLHPDC